MSAPSWPSQTGVPRELARSYHASVVAAMREAQPAARRGIPAEAAHGEAVSGTPLHRLSPAPGGRCGSPQTTFWELRPAAPAHLPAPAPPGLGCADDAGAALGYTPDYRINTVTSPTKDSTWL
jgi:hypothetical protein